MATWKGFEDIKRDVFEYSDMEYPGTFAPAPPKSIAEYRSRTSQIKNPGLFDDPIIGDQCEVFISGRGKYQRDRIIKPGRPVESYPEDDSILQKKIREVSGLGYRNEIIERVFRSPYEEKEEALERGETEVLQSTEIKLLPSGSSLSSKSNSARSSPLNCISPDERDSSQSTDEVLSTEELQVTSVPSKDTTRKGKKRFIPLTHSKSENDNAKGRSEHNNNNWRSECNPSNWKNNDTSLGANDFPPLRNSMNVTRGNK